MPLSWHAAPRVALGLLVAVPLAARGQSLSLSGEASVSATANRASEDSRQLLARYLPELSGTLQPEDAKVGVDFRVAGDLWASRTWRDGSDTVDRDEVELYRGWVRLASPRFELRAGLQKISFGSATVFRPLMWFDRLDPRDPLQLSEGVEALLGRAHLPKNVTLWAWAVRGEDEAKGWERIPSRDGEVELGGRLQVPFGPGELAATFHRRDVDLGALAPPGVDPVGSERRVGLDGKWDLGIGLWFEAVAARYDAPLVADDWTRSWAVGMDYTFEVGNGLTFLVEHFRQESPTLRIPETAASPQTPPGDGSGIAVPSGLPTGELRLTAFTVAYPLGVLDRIALALYRDGESGEDFRLLEWRRTWDRWRLHVLGFWNPDDRILFPSGSAGSPGAADASPLAGTGVQLVVVFHH